MCTLGLERGANLGHTWDIVPGKKNKSTLSQLLQIPGTNQPSILRTFPGIDQTHLHCIPGIHQSPQPKEGCYFLDLKFVVIRDVTIVLVVDLFSRARAGGRNAQEQNNSRCMEDGVSRTTQRRRLSPQKDEANVCYYYCVRFWRMRRGGCEAGVGKI